MGTYWCYRYVRGALSKKGDASVPQTLGARLKQHRLSLRLTQQEVATQLHLVQQWVSSIERGVFEPSIDRIQQLMQVYGLPAEFFLNPDSAVEPLHHQQSALCPLSCCQTM